MILIINKLKCNIEVDINLTYLKNTLIINDEVAG